MAMFRRKRRLETTAEPPAASPDAAALEYFCYVSRNKVDQLYAQLDPEAAYEITDTRTAEKTLTADAHADWNILHVISLFRVGGTYGRKGVIQREAKVKQTYMTKLEAVCLALAGRTPIAPAERLPSQATAGKWCHHHGVFRVKEPLTEAQVDTVVTLESDVAERHLLLDCSLRNFSEGPQADGSFGLTSTNARFFEGDVALPMTTIFLLLESGDARIVGSPLFLKLSSGDIDPESGMLPAL